MRIKHLWLLLFGSLLFAQTPVQIANPCFQQACFHAYTAPTLTSSSSTTLTIQEPTATSSGPGGQVPAGVKQVNFLVAVVNCSGQPFTITQAENGAAATATAGTALALDPGSSKTAAAKVWTASNVGTGTATAAPLSYTIGDPRTIDLTQRSMGVASHNYSITLTNNGSSSCTGSIDIYWSEQQ